MCGTCQAQPAGVFCLCQSVPTFICQTCIQAHCTQNPSSVHDFCPIKDIDYLQEISLGEYKQRKLRIAQGMIALEKTKEKEENDYQKVKQSLTEVFQKTLYLMDSLHNVLTQTMEITKEKLQHSLYSHENEPIVAYLLTSSPTIQGVQMSLYDIPVLTNINNQASLLSHTITNFNTLDFSEYTLSSLKGVQFDVSANPESKQEPPYCPVIMGNSLRKYYAGQSGRLGLVELTHTPKVDQETAYAFLENGDLVCCGGVKGAQEAYVIGAVNAQVTILPKMIQGRSAPGMVTFNGCPYVFGGSSGTNLLTTCEKFTHMERWEIIKEQMARPRGAFTPCLYNNLIYLPGGFSANTIECFDPIRSVFALCPQMLPASGKTISFVSSSTLYIFLNSEIFTMDVSAGSSDIVHVKSVKVAALWSPICPIVFGGKVMFWSFEEMSVGSLWRELMRKRHGICYSFDVPSRELKEEERFEYVIS